MSETFNLMVASAKRYPLPTAQQELLISRQIRELLDTEKTTRLQVKRWQRAKGYSSII
ncbi:hypothetical protein [Synechococcus sp. UW179A]|uniref:hypothetical protein n=1 Tax=Synechococcus sp. UW179A TaxID=2575510 RepID=UPI0014825A29|nr:hypothetical protein [Synechococcus sp. UW179A]